MIALYFLAAGMAPLASPASLAPGTPNLASYVGKADYPPDALAHRAEGQVAFRLSITPQGRVDACTITRSSGSAALDVTTCRIMKSRARFVPARDSSGQPVADSLESLIRWVLPASA